MKEIAIIGGTGFVGRSLAARFARANQPVRVLTRKRERKRDLLVFPQLQLIEANVHDRQALDEHLAGVGAVINLSGILNEQGRDGFERVHVALATNIAQSCVKNGIPRLLHMSALGAATDAPSAYLRTKAAGEEAVHALPELNTTSFRPSVIFGPRDDFFNRFAQLLRMSPGVFPLACPNAKFAPVYVEDVVEAMVRSLGDAGTFGKRYEFCGPEVYTLRELVEYTASVAGLHRKIIPLSDGLSALQGKIMERLPGRPFSRDNYLSTKVDSVSNNNALQAFGIEPHSLESVVPTYIGLEERNARYGKLRRVAHRD